MGWARASLRVVCCLLLLAGWALGGTPGSFRGVLLEGANTKPGWMYVQSRNDMLRLVQVRGAQVWYGEEIPQKLRQTDASASLQSGAEVRVLAEEDGHGHWRAREIEILRLRPTRRAEKQADNTDER
jgi:hypothetical protein